MRYHFKQSVHLNKKTYGLGTHEVPEDVESHPYFLKMVKAGSVVEGEPEESTIKLESPEERSKRLYQRLLSRRKPVKAPEPKSGKPLAESEAEAEAKSKVDAKARADAAAKAKSDAEDAELAQMEAEEKEQAKKKPKR